MRIITLLCFLFAPLLYAQNVRIPDYYVFDTALNRELGKIVSDMGLDKDFYTDEDGWEQISLAVIDLNGEKPEFGGVHYDNFIYPASVYKMYVAAGVLDRISRGEISLTTSYIARFPNVVDHTKQIDDDPRPLLQEGDTVTVNYLLDLMITRSDNSAANCLIDIARRKNIDSLLHSYNWYGSEVTRKFLKCQYEDSAYKDIRGTETCALHAADFLYRIYTNRLVNPWVSMQMMTLLGRQLDNSKLAAALPPHTMFYHKTGWYADWTHDAGIVDTGELRYIIACFLPLEAEQASDKFRILSGRVFELIKRRNR